MRYSTIVLLLAFLLTTAVALAQTPNRDTIPGVWKAWSWEVSPGDVTQSGATQADMKALVAKLLELREVLKAAPSVAEPIGFNAYLQGHFDGVRGPSRDPKARTAPLGARLWFGAFPHEFDRAGNLTGRFGETELLPIQVNEVPVGAPPSEWDRLETDVVLQPKPMPDFAGLPRFGDYLVLKKNPKPIWAPVSMDASLQLVAAQRKKAIADHEKAAEQIRRSLAEWIDPARKAERVKRYQGAAATQKDPDAYMAEREKADRQTEEALRKQVDGDASPVNNRYWAADLATVAAVDQALAAMSAEQKAAPACYAEQKGRSADDRPLSKIVPANTPGCQAIVRPNPDYFDRKLPRTAFQVLTIGMVSRCVDDPAQARNTHRWGCPANIALLKSVDWQKVAALLDR